MTEDVSMRCIEALAQALNSDNPQKELFSIFLSVECEIYNRALADAIGSIREYPHSDLIIEKLKSLSLSTTANNAESVLLRVC